MVHVRRPASGIDGGNAAPRGRRYIWLPMWVVEVPGADGRDIAVAQQRVRRRRRFRHMRGGPAAANGTLPPVDVVVRWIFSVGFPNPTNTLPGKCIRPPVLAHLTSLTPELPRQGVIHPGRCASA